MMKKNHRPQKGFSLLEMTVVLAIVAIMTAIVLMNLPQMKGGLSIDVVAQEIAIYIRGAQVYSQATKLNKNYSSYGIHFDSTQGRSFFLWADSNDSVGIKPVRDAIFYWQDGLCSGLPCDPKPEIYELPQGFTIAKLLCVTDDNPSTITRTNLDIVFKLPDPEAQFANTGEASSNGSCYDAERVKVCLRSANGSQYRIIEIHANGQIAVVKDTENECLPSN